MTVPQAVERAFEIMVDVQSTLQDRVDNASERWQESDAGQTFADVIATIENSTSEPEMPDWIADDEIESTEIGKSSRPARRDEACGLLDKVIELARSVEACEDVDDESKAELGAFIETLTETKDEWDGIDFP